MPTSQDLPNPGIEPASLTSPTLQADSLPIEPTGKLKGNSNYCCFVQLLSHVQLSCDPMDCSPPGSSVHRISQARYWTGLPFPSPEDLPDPGIKPGSPALQTDSLLSQPQRSPTLASLLFFKPAGIFLPQDLCTGFSWLIFTPSSLCIKYRSLTETYPITLLIPALLIPHIMLYLFFFHSSKTL